ADRQLRRPVQLQLDDQLHLRRRRRAGVPEGDDHPRQRVVRQHQGEQEQPRSGPVGWLRRSHGRRDGARVDERRLPERRRIQGSRRRAQSEGGENHRRAPAVNRLALMCAAGVLAGGILVSGQQLPEPRKAFGSSITGAFEGWYYNADGSRTWLLGYLNRNFGQALDVPIGPNNRIEPGGPDMGQPTHFMPGRNWGMFTVPVPK